MNSDKLGLKKEFLNLYLHAVLAHFTAIVVFILGSKHIVNSYDKLPDFIPLISSYYFNIIMLLMGVFFFFYMLFEVYLKRMIQILNAAKFSAPFYIFSIFIPKGIIIYLINKRLVHNIYEITKTSEKL